MYSKEMLVGRRLGYRWWENTDLGENSFEVSCRNLKGGGRGDNCVFRMDSMVLTPKIHWYSWMKKKKKHKGT